MLEVVQILENMREVQGKPAIFGEKSEEFWQKNHSHNSVFAGII